LSSPAATARSAGMSRIEVERRGPLEGVVDALQETVNPRRSATTISLHASRQDRAAADDPGALSEEARSAGSSEAPRARPWRPAQGGALASARARCRGRRAAHGERLGRPGVVLRAALVGKWLEFKAIVAGTPPWWSASRGAPGVGLGLARRRAGTSACPRLATGTAAALSRPELCLGLPSFAAARGLPTRPAR
jgi:hypothetical protein